MTTAEVFVSIIKNDSLTRERPSYLLDTEYEPNDRAAALLEDSDFLFLTKEHPDRFCQRLGSTPSEMALLWKNAGDGQRSQIFRAMKQPLNKRRTK